MHPLWDQLERAASLRGDQPAVRSGSQALSWREALGMAGRMACVLSGNGVRDGAGVALISPNSLAGLLLPFAAECAGGMFVPLNNRLTCAELVEQLLDFRPALLLAAPPYVDIAREAAAIAGVPVMLLGDVAEGDEPRFDSLAADAEPLAPCGISRDAPVAIYYTGGTTGRAKGVILTSDRLAMNALQWAHAVGARQDEHLLVVAPMFHMVAGLNCIIAAVLACDLTILDRFTPAGTLDAISKLKVTNLAMVPAMIEMLFAEPGFAGHDLSSLRILTYGGSPISQPTLAATLENFPGVRLYQVYGQTEGGPTVSILGPEWHTLDPAHAGRLHSAGKPLALTAIRIIRPDGSACDRGETGEILVRGPAVSPGYWNRPEETAAAYRDGWLHTGDAGYLDGDSFLFIVDRIKDMIVSGGENVYAAEVERVIVLHPAVRDCAVIGIPSERWGEAVHAIVRLEDGARADEAVIIAFCREHISAFKLPRSVEFREAPFPLTGANKVDKRALRKDHAGTSAN
ncbi:MAG: AMP-binding protein [Sphingomonadales bacterium]|nr:AMP-binding protein [Sphingomonadales bacterium]MDE2568442.1 AMP-binding protein [Sphingomonadales bacterium]